MSRLTLLALASLVSSGFAATPVPKEPTAKALVAGLSDPSEKVRNESATALKNRADALPWLRRAVRAADKDTVRRAAELLAPAENERQEIVARAIGACIREGQVDLFLEWHQYWQPENKADLWPVGPRAAQAGMDLYANSCRPEAAKSFTQALATPGAKIRNHDGPEPARPLGSGVWNIRADRWNRWPEYAWFASIAAPTRPAAGGVGRYFVLGSVQLGGVVSDSFIVCDGDAGTVPLAESGQQQDLRFGIGMLVCRGNFRGQNVGDAVLLAGGDIDLTRTTRIENSLIRAGGEIRFPPNIRPVNCTIEAHAKNATAPYKFFELSDVGLSLADDEEGLVVTAVKADTPFGNCGIAKGDIVRAIDDASPGGSEECRKLVRRALVRQGDCLITVARGDKTLDLPVFFPLPK